MRNGISVGSAIEFEVANTPELRSKGLMYRRELPESRGMIFIFPRSEPRSFWMHNTYVSLDMLFLSEEARVQGILERVPILNDIPRGISGLRSKFVVELVAGVSAKYGIKAGDLLQFDSILPQAEG